MNMREIINMGMKIKAGTVKGLAVGLCLAVLAPAAAAAMMPEMVVSAAQTGGNSGSGTSDETKNNKLEETEKNTVINNAVNQLNDYKIYIDPDGKYTVKLQELIDSAKTRMITSSIPLRATTMTTMTKRKKIRRLIRTIT